MSPDHVRRLSNCDLFDQEIGIGKKEQLLMGGGAARKPKAHDEEQRRFHQF
jgi:hypothetical protein